MRACILLAAVLPVALASQRPLSLPTTTPPPLTAQSTTLIDALSADGNYTRLLRLIQRARLVPTLNRLNGSTLFAPTNAAIQTHPLFAAPSDADTYTPLADNIQHALRQTLFYHLLNTTITALPAPAHAPRALRTLLFPRPAEDPPQDHPWLPVPGGTLGGAPQRVRWTTRQDNSTWLGTDYAGAGGVQVVRPIVDAGNGALIGVSGFLQPPTNLSHIISQEPALSYMYSLLPPALRDTLATAPHLSVFLPNNSAWDALPAIERLYLQSEFATDDLHAVLGMHAVATNAVLWSDAFNASSKVTTMNGNNLTISTAKNGTTRVAEAAVLHPDIYASNGVLHIVSKLLIPPGAIQLTPEKYLLALNCTAFVRLLRSVELAPLVNTTNATYTILAPRDDVISLGGGSLPEKGTAALARVLRYHFLPGRWTAKKLRDGMLVQTALEEEGLGGGRQVLDIGVTAKGDERELTFGGAGIIGKPLEINNTIIYLISRPLIPPGDVLQMALPSLQFSTFLAAVYATSLGERLKRAASTTLLIPQNAAWEGLGLVTKHLLSAAPGAQGDLEAVVLHHAVEGVAYLDALVNGTQKTYATRAGSDVRVARRNGTVYVVPSGGWEGMEGRVVGGNVLTATGVVHELAGALLLPRSVNVTVGKLARAAQGTTMAGLLAKAGMGWVLNGTAAPEGSWWEGSEGAWTLLCPTDDSFKGVNMTALWADEEGLRQVVAQHLIPGAPTQGLGMKQALAGLDQDANRPLYMDESATYSTVLSRESVYGDVVFRAADGGGYMVGIKDARGTAGANDWANVVSWGRSTTGGGGGAGGVVQIDRLLVPYRPSVWAEYGGPVGVGIVGVGLIAGFFWVVGYVWRRETTEATYEPVGGFDREDDD